LREDHNEERLKEEENFKKQECQRNANENNHVASEIAEKQRCEHLKEQYEEAVEAERLHNIHLRHVTRIVASLEGAATKQDVTLRVSRLFADLLGTGPRDTLDP